MDELPPWARLPGEEAAGQEPDTAPPSDAARVEAALRWRLVLGRYAEEHLPSEAPPPSNEPGEEPQDLTDRVGEAERIDQSLQFIYDREFARRAHRQVGPGGGEGLTIPAWLRGVRELFPEEAVHVIERDALARYGMTELVTDPDVLRRAEPTPDLMKAILQFKHMMKPDVVKVARDLVRAVVLELSGKLEASCAPSLRGAVDPSLRPPRRTVRNTDWHRTIRRNLNRWDQEEQRLVPERIYFRHRQHERMRWRIIVAVDQSGSMLDSLIHSAIMAAIFTTLPAVEVNLVLWDHRVCDVSHLAEDPLEVLMSCQLGGGTAMLPALQYCAGLVTEPERTILVLISDFYIWGEGPACLQLAQELAEAGVHGFGLAALDERSRPVYDERFARDLANAGWFVAALTPAKLAEHVAKRIG